MEIGEVWAYREKQGAPLLEVEIRKLRMTYPPRARVEFMDDRFGGDTKWVPAGRLKCPWAKRENLFEYEARWAELEADGEPDDDERDAAGFVFDELAPDAIQLHHEGSMGIGNIRDLNRLTELLGWDAEDIAGSPGAMADGQVLRIRWFLTRRIARELAQVPGSGVRISATRADGGRRVGSGAPRENPCSCATDGRSRSQGTG